MKVKEREEKEKQLRAEPDPQARMVIFVDESIKSLSDQRPLICELGPVDDEGYALLRVKVRD